MNAVLPDVSLTDNAPILTPLQWVGMEGIDLPIRLAEPDGGRELHARVDAQVDLPAPHIKGIHMSRLYRLLDRLTETGLTPECLQQVLQAMIESHRDCDSRSARLGLSFDLLMRRPALVSALSGWKSYPVRLEVMQRDEQFSLRVDVVVEYSSTCPCSAALARQLVERRFLDTFAEDQPISRDEMAHWLRQNATLATPHSQRSEAHVSVELDPASTSLRLSELIDSIETAVATPVQTAVKRADEQAFAALNGANLMFVEDAARRIRQALQQTFNQPRIQVKHLESLHPHDAVALAE
jgi:GTP cyclohydrolase I